MIFGISTVRVVELVAGCNDLRVLQCCGNEALPRNAHRTKRAAITGRP